MKKNGLLIVYTGEGKGKTTAAFGLALRAWGRNLRVLIIQFIKEDCAAGEQKAVACLDSRIELRTAGMGFTRRGGKQELHREKAEEALTMACQEAASGKWDMLILDEVLYAVSFGLLPEAEVMSLAEGRPKSLHLVLTGRGASAALMEAADLVTEMRCIRHPLQNGVTAQEGIEF